MARTDSLASHRMAQRRDRGACGRCAAGGAGVAKRRREVGDASTTVAAVGGHLDYPADLRAILGTMLDDPQLSELCDVVIVVDGVRFPAHRAVLAAASRVFKAMFTNCMRERDAREIELSALDHRSWRMALQYIYTAQVDIADEDSALLLLSSARMYQLETLESFVEKFLVSRLKVANCFELLGHAEHYDLDELKRESKTTMEDRFEAVSMSPAFLDCPFELVDELLASTDLVVRSEMQVFNAVARWVTATPLERNEADGIHDGDDCGGGENGRCCDNDSGKVAVPLPDSQDNTGARGIHAEKLLRHVDLGKLNEAQLKAVGRHALSRQCARFRDQALERLLYWSTDAVGDGLLASGWHLKARKRCARVFTFACQQRGMTVSSSADDEEVVRTPWASDDSGRIIWRLKMYPRGYNKAKGQYLSMYVQARSAFKSETLGLSARFDIFLINRKDAAATISFSSQHRFTKQSDHWGFHRFLSLGQMLDANAGFIDIESDSLLVGANIYY